MEAALEHSKMPDLQREYRIVFLRELREELEKVTRFYRAKVAEFEARLHRYSARLAAHVCRAIDARDTSRLSLFLTMSCSNAHSAQDAAVTAQRAPLEHQQCVRPPLAAETLTPTSPLLPRGATLSPPPSSPLLPATIAPDRVPAGLVEAPRAPSSPHEAAHPPSRISSPSQAATSMQASPLPPRAPDQGH